VGGIIHNASEMESEESASDTALLMEKMWQVHVFGTLCINLAFEDYYVQDAKLDGQAEYHFSMTDYVAEKGSDKHICLMHRVKRAWQIYVFLCQAVCPSDYTVNAIAPSLLMFNSGDDVLNTVVRH